MGLQYSAAISELLKSIRTVPFNLTVKDDKLSGVYEHCNTTTRIHYSSKHGYELYVIRGNVIEFSYITDKLTNFTHCLNDVMKGVVTEVDHEEVLQLKQRIRELEQLVKLDKLIEIEENAKQIRSLHETLRRVNDEVNKPITSYDNLIKQINIAKVNRGCKVFKL